MKNLSLAIFLSATLAQAESAMASNNWSSMSCTGSDTTGKYMYLTASSSSSYVDINGSKLLVVGKTKNGQGVVTEQFIATNGVLVYDSIVPTSNTTLNIYQFNAVTQALLAQASLSCLISANSSSMSKVIEQRAFKAINTTDVSSPSKKSFDIKGSNINVASCDMTFRSKGACDNWFAAQGMWGSPYYHLCCDKLK